MKEGYKKTELGWIPEEWEVNSLNNISYLIMGQSPDSNTYNEDGIGVPFFQGKTEFGRINPIIKKWCSKPTKIAEPLDVLISVRAPVGDVNINIMKSCIGRGLAAIRAKNSNYKFIYYYMQSIKRKLNLSAQGSTFTAINSSDLKNFKIIVPSLEEQEKIAEILSTVDSQIDDTEKIIEKTKELKKGLMQRLLTKGIGHSEFKKSEVGEIPVEWEVRQIGDIANIRSSKRVYQNEYMDKGIPFYRSKEIIELSKNIEPTTELYISEEKYLEFVNKFGAPKKGDLLITSVGSVGMTWVSDGRKFYYKDGNLTQIESNKNINTNFISYVFNSDYLKKQYLGQSNGSAQIALTLEKLRKLIIALPSLDEQKEIVKILSSVDIQIQEYKNKKTKLEELKEGLIQQLLTGKIRVV